MILAPPHAKMFLCLQEFLIFYIRISNTLKDFYYGCGLETKLCQIPSLISTTAGKRLEFAKYVEQRW